MKPVSQLRYVEKFHLKSAQHKKGKKYVLKHTTLKKNKVKTNTINQDSHLCVTISGPLTVLCAPLNNSPTATSHLPRVLPPSANSSGLNAEGKTSAEPC